MQWRQLYIRFSARSFYYLWHWLCKQKLQWHHDGAESIFHFPVFPKFRRIWTFNLGRITKKTFLYLFINFWPYKNQTQSEEIINKTHMDLFSTFLVKKLVISEKKLLTWANMHEYISTLTTFQASSVKYRSSDLVVFFKKRCS